MTYAALILAIVVSPMIVPASLLGGALLTLGVLFAAMTLWSDDYDSWYWLWC